MHASQSPQPSHPHNGTTKPHRQTKDDHKTTDTPQGHRPSSKRERNIITLQVNITGIKNKLEELKLLIHDTHVDIITIQETKLTPKANTPKVHNFTTVRADRLPKAGGEPITLIIFTTTDIRSTINTHNTELQMARYTLTALNISQLLTFIYLLETTHPCTTNQLARTYNTAYSTSRTYHTQSSPEM